MDAAVSIALFIRHGKASAFGSSADYDQLSPPGVEQSEKLGEWLAGQGLESVHNLSGGIDAWSREVDPKVPLY